MLRRCTLASIILVAVFVAFCLFEIAHRTTDNTFLKNVRSGMPRDEPEPGRRERSKFPVDPPDEVHTKSLIEDEFRALQRLAVPVSVAEARVHEYFPPWSANPRARGVSPAMNTTVAASRQLSGRAQTPARLTAFWRAMAGASVPKPAVGACLNLIIDLQSLGYPGVVLSMGLEGELQYDICDRCFTWNFEAVLGFSVGVSVLGFSAYFQLTLSGHLDLKEVTCETAHDSNFCRYLHFVLPEYVNRMTNKNSRCHSDSPFDAITAYIKYQYASLQNWINDKFYSGENKRFAESPLAQNLNLIEEGLKKYPAVFRPTQDMDAVLNGLAKPKPEANPVYLYGTYNDDACPPGSVNVMSKSGCKAAATALNKWWGGTKDQSDAPRGCYEYNCGSYCPNTNVRFNEHSKGSIDSWSRAVCVRLPGDDVRAVQFPTKVTMDGQGTQYIWMVALERRLCWAPTWPTVTQGGDRGYDDFVALHGQCANSVEVSNLPQGLGEITLKNKRVEVPTQRDRGTPLKIDFASNEEAAKWLYMLINYVVAARKDKRRILASKCMRAELETSYDAYCALEVPGQWWATSYLPTETKKPSWGEGVGLRIGAEEVAANAAAVRVAIHDMSIGVLERAYKWFTGSSDVDPLLQYVGQSRLSVCTVQRNAQWRVINSQKGCEYSVAVEGWKYHSGNSGLQNCKRMCEELPGCAAVDYRDSDGLCNIFNKACDNPSYSARRRSVTSSHGLVKLGCDAVHSPGLHPVDVEAKLWLRKDHWESWNPINWLRGAEYLKAGKAWLQFEWKGEAPIRESWHPRTPNEALSMPGLRDAAQAMFVAVDSMVAKLPSYARQVAQRLKVFDKNNPQYEDGLLDYATQTGRFMARWHPEMAAKIAEKEGLTTTPMPQEVFSCPPPGDACTAHLVHCQKAKNEGSTNSWSQYLMEQWRVTMETPPCSDADLSDPKVDDRVVHFRRAIDESIYSQKIESTVRFHAEAATSVLNLFVRVVKDVHALWASYFADDPAWNGNCHSAIPYFLLPYEFGPDITQGVQHLWSVRTQESDFKEFIEYRAAGLASHQKGSKMASEDNPFCRWKWAASRKAQDRRADFVKQDAPIHGRDGHSTPPSELSAAMFPHLWCIALDATRGSNLTSPLKGTKLENGTLIRYSSSCQQVRHFVLDGKRETKTWRRFDCEETVLTRPFVTFFPDFVKQVIGNGSHWGVSVDTTGALGAFGQLGAVVEDVLQCAAHISSNMREFPSRSSVVDIDALCDSSERHLELLEKADQDEEDFRIIVSFVKAQTLEAIELLNKFLNVLKSDTVADNMAADFRRLFSYYDALDAAGTLMTGEAWRAGLSKALEKLGTESAALARIDESKEQAVTAAFHALDPSNIRVTSLFPVPVQYRAAAEVSVGIVFEKGHNLCHKRLPTSLTFAVSGATEGQTWFSSQPNSNKVCVRGSFTPIPTIQLAITVEGCWATLPHLTDGTIENTWRLQAKALILEETITLIGNAEDSPNAGGRLLRESSLVEELAKQQQDSSERLTVETVESANKNIGWQMVRQVFLDPSLLLAATASLGALFGGTVAALSFAGSAVGGLATGMQDSIKVMATKATADSVYKEIADAADEERPFYAGLDLKMLGFLDVTLELQRLQSPEASGPWEKSFDVHWTNRNALAGRIDIPDFAALDTRISMSSVYDLSEIFNTLFLDRATPYSNYDCCIKCLQKVGALFCPSSAPQGSQQLSAPRCLQKGSQQCNADLVIQNITSCQDDALGHVSLAKEHRLLCDAPAHAVAPKEIQGRQKEIFGGKEIQASGSIAEVTGSITLNVVNATSFAKDVKAQNAMRTAVASMAGVSADLVTVWLSAERRLQDSSTGKVRVNYKIRQTSASDAAKLVNNMKALDATKVATHVNDSLKTAQVQGVQVEVLGITAEVVTTTTSTTLTTSGATTTQPRADIFSGRRTMTTTLKSAYAQAEVYDRAHRFASLGLVIPLCLVAAHWVGSSLELRY